MALDGFSMSNMGLPKDITSAQAAATAEHIINTGNEKIVGKIDRTVNKKITDEEKEEQEKRKNKQEFFDDGFQEDDDSDDNSLENENNSIINDEYSKRKLRKNKLISIKDLENVTLRFSNAFEKVELFNTKTKKIIDTINTDDFVDMISNLDYNSGILVNKNI